MIKKIVENIIFRYGIWRVLQMALLGISLIFLLVAISQLLISVNSNTTPVQVEAGYISEGIPNKDTSQILAENEEKRWEENTYRPGLFKPATGLKDKPLANRTIERIKDQLNLQCIMEMNGETVAYINIQGIGLKKCRVGENIHDLFTVLNINSKSVDISIVEHKVTLHL